MKTKETPKTAQTRYTDLSRIASDFLNNVIEIAAIRRDTQKLWFEIDEAVAFLGMPKERIIALGKQGEIAMDRKTPEKERSHYIFERDSLIAYSRRHADKCMGLVS